MKPTSTAAEQYPGGLALNYKVVCVVYYSLQGYTDLIIRSAFAQQYTEYDTLPLCTLGSKLVDMAS